MSTVLSIEQEAIIVALRRHTLLSLDDCLYAPWPTIRHPTSSSVHRCLKRHGISRLSEVEGNRPGKHKFKVYPIGYFHIDIAEVRTGEGKFCLFVAIGRTSKFVFADLPRNRDGWTTRYCVHRFDQICGANGVEHRPTGPNHPWTNG